MKKLPENWREIIHDMFSEGAHVSEVIKALGFTRSTHETFYRQHDEYRTEFKNGRMLAEAWWAGEGRANLGNKNFNNTLFIFMMKAVFKWKDTHPEAKDQKGFINDEEKQAMLKKYKMDVEESDSLN